MKFFTGGSEKLTILLNGDVGIGSTLPTEKLDVNGTIQCLNELRSTTGNDLLLNAGSVNRDVKIQVNDANMLYVKGDTGRIGIGTDAPTARLHVNGTSNGLQARFGGTGTGLGISCGQNLILMH